MEQNNEPLSKQTPESATPEELLDYDDYNNYRSVRVITVIFVVFAGIMTVVGAIWLIAGLFSQQDFPGLIIAAGILLFGIAGFVGGRSVLRGDKSGANLLYAIAVLYLFAFPIGTVLAYRLIKGLPKYLDTMEMIADARSGKRTIPESN